MLKPKISIIVPVYNVEVYIKRCLDSLINQSLKEIEIIVVDDCSHDNSIEIIHEFMKKDDRILLLQNKKNCGLSITRNNGIKHAKGKYLLFVDSDDWIHKTSCQILFNIAEKESLDILEGDALLINKWVPDKQQENNFRNIHTFNGSRFLKYHPFCPSVCNKLWLKDFINNNNLLFPEGRYLEDGVFSINAIIEVKKIAKISFEFYYYFQSNKDSILSKKINSKIVKDRTWQLQFFTNKLKKYQKTAFERSLKVIIVERLRAALVCVGLYETKDQYRKHLKEETYNAWKFSRNIILKTKSIPIIKRLVLYISPWLYLYIIKFYNKFLCKNIR